MPRVRVFVGMGMGTAKNTHGLPMQNTKAYQLHSCIEFDIPVLLMKLWSEVKPNEGNVLDDRRHKVLNSTMLLATALRWGTSHRTSAKHAAEYMKNMRAYLASLRDLFPNMDLCTSHHNALFIGEMLL